MGVLHYDLGSLAPAKRLPNGSVCAEALFTRTGIFEYRNPDGSVRRELRLPEEVFRPDSMRSFALVPFCDDHPPEMLTAANATQYAKGGTGDSVVRDQDHLRGTVGVWDAPTITKMDAGKLEVSCGYTCDLDETPGVHPLWGPYDAIQKNIVGNHLALVDRGRAGSASIRMDAAVMVRTDADWDESAHPRDKDGKLGSGGGAAAAVAERASAISAAAHEASKSAGKSADKHMAAAALHGEAAHAQLAAGNRAGYDEHAEARKNEMRTGTAIAANAASAKANASGNPTDHAHAADLALQARDAHFGTNQEKSFLQMYKQHEALSGSQDRTTETFNKVTGANEPLKSPNLPFAPKDAVVEANKASSEANSRSQNGAMTPAQHSAAASAHLNAAALQYRVGNNHAAEEHNGAAQFHNNAKIALEHSAEAKESTARALSARASASAAANGRAADDHRTAAAYAKAAASHPLGGSFQAAADYHTAQQAAHAIAARPSGVDSVVPRSRRGKRDSGTELASYDERGIILADMYSKRTDDGPAVTGEVDPDDLANRNARGANNAPVKERDEMDPGDDDMPEMDAAGCGPGMKYGDEDEYDDDGTLNQAARDKMKSSNFALPDQEKLPIHDPKHVRAAMSRFGQTDFPDADSKHAAFNRIKRRAAQFGIGTTGFDKAHSKNLDKLDRTDMLEPVSNKELAQKAAKRKEKLAKRKARIDALEKELAAEKGKVASLTTDLERAKADATKARSDGDDRFDAAVDAKVDIVTRAIEVLGRAEVDKVTKQARTDSKQVTRALKLAVIKHVDKKDVPDKQPEPYVDALFDGAVERARADAAAVAGGARAIADARAATGSQPLPAPTASQAPAGVAHNDADDPEEAARRNMRARGAAAAAAPGAITKSAVLGARLTK